MLKPENQNNQPRVLIFYPALAPYRIKLFNALVEIFRLRLILLHENHTDQKFDQKKFRGQTKADHGYLLNGFTFLSRTIRFGVWREICKFKPDIIITREFDPTTLVVAVRRLIQAAPFRHVIWTADNPESVAADNFIRRILRWLVLPRIDGLIVLSDEAGHLYRTRYRANVPIRASAVLHEEESFRRELYQSTDIAKFLSVKYSLVGKRILLYVGRLSPEKRIDRLLKTFSSIYKTIPDVVLVLVGNGPEQDSLQALAKSLGVSDRVLFTGRLENQPLYAWYLLGQLFVLPSELERFASVVNEALLAGIPAICSDQAGARVLIKNGINGTVVDASNQTELETAIRLWLEKIIPFTTASLKIIRPSLMTMSFKSTVDGFASIVETVLEKKSCEVKVLK